MSRPQKQKFIPQLLDRKTADLQIEQAEKKLGIAIEPFFPEQVLFEVAARVRQGIVDDSGIQEFGAPHIMMRMLAAAAWYYRPHKRRDFSVRQFQIIHDLISSHSDPVLMNSVNWIDGDFLLFFLYVHRTQPQLQYHLDIDRIFARSFLLFGDETKLPVVSQLFQRATGMGLSTWILIAGHLCLRCVPSNLRKTESQFTIGQFAEEFAPFISIGEINAFINQAIQTWRELGDRYGKMLQDCQTPRTRSMFLPLLFDKPVIRASTAAVVPFPSLLSQLLVEVVYKYVISDGQGDQEVSGNEVGDAVNKYVGLVTRSCSKVAKILDDSVLEWEGESCDYVFEFEKCVLFVECKATAFRNDVISQNSVESSGIYKKYKKGICQIVETAVRAKAGGIAVCDSKPWLGVVVTLGQLAGSESCWFRDAARRELPQSVLDQEQQLLQSPVVCTNIDSYEEFFLREESVDEVLLSVFSTLGASSSFKDPGIVSLLSSMPATTEVDRWKVWREGIGAALEMLKAKSVTRPE